jgi:hypothetical protein
MPRDDTMVGDGTSNSMPSAGFTVMVCEKPSSELDVAALAGGTVADALDLEPLLEALRDA